MNAAEKIDILSVNKIFDNVIESIDHSRDRILDLVSDARKEHELLKEQLEKVQGKIDNAITKVDDLEKKDRIARNSLAVVSKNFRSNSETEIKKAYDKATEIRIELKIAQKEEENLRDERNRIEIAIKNAIKNIQNAEQVVHQVSVAASYLKGEILDALEEAGFGMNMMMGVRILEAQENERRRISRDIHDGPAQRVANIVMKADLCEKIARKDLDAGLKELSTLKEASRIALKEVRDIIYNLRPMSLDDLGLNKTIEMNTSSVFEGSEIHIDYKLAKVPDALEEIIQLAVFRISQEILNNIKKHSNANHVYIKTEYGTKYMRITIGDDGKGFDVEETLIRVKREKKNYGLLGMIERVEQLKGEILIESSELTGSVFSIKLPLNREVILSE
ncbi:MAG: sensor histidine kinase [Clostridia bacterium]|nr:sensor histidine kinase [Clostridia bacterium]